MLGFPVRIHWTLPVAVLLLGLLSGAGARGVLLASTMAFGLFASVLLHELGHAVVARRYGVGVSGILLTPIGGMSFLDGIPRRSSQEAAVALAGPLVSLALAGLFTAGALLFDGGIAPGSALSVLAVMNLVLGLFNMIPAFPMDGGRVLRAALTPRLGLVRATRTAAAVGRLVAVGAGVWALATSQWVLALIAVYVWFAGRMEERGVITREAIAGLTAAQVMQSPVRALRPGMGAVDAWREIQMLPQKIFPVLWGEVVLGIITKAELSHLSSQTGDDGPLSLHIDRDVLRVDEGTTVEDVLAAMVAARKGAAVVTQQGALSGVLTIDDMLERAQRLHELSRAAPGYSPNPSD
jgi:Zn-dependent protease/predicted transcriptional regulator